MGASWDEARRCPDDGSSGEIVSTKMIGEKEGAPPGSKLITLICKNTRCEYNETPFVVQINPDGTIPEPTLDRDKFYPSMGNFSSNQRARDVVAELAEQYAREQKPGAEVRNR